MDSKGLIIEEQEVDNKNYNPSAFKVIDETYEEEEKLLSKLKFKTAQDKYVFDALPLLPTQKLSIVYQLIVENDECIEVDEELRKKILNIVSSQDYAKTLP